MKIAIPCREHVADILCMFAYVSKGRLHGSLVCAIITVLKFSVQAVVRGASHPLPASAIDYLCMMSLSS